MRFDYENWAIGDLVPARILLDMYLLKKTLNYLWVGGKVPQLFSSYRAIVASVLSKIF